MGETHLQCGTPARQELPADFLHSNNFVHGTAYSDLYRATRTNGTKIAIKRLRFYSEKDKNMFIDEIHKWSGLQHDNVARLIVYSFDPYGYPLVVTDWMDDGSAWDYVNSRSDSDVLRLLTETADALSYIHDMQAVHSDVKSDNILVALGGHARLCDFGVSRMVSTSSSMANLSTGPSGTIRYLPYEFFSGYGDELMYTSKSDVWAFGMTVYELMTRKRPYDGLSEDRICLALMDAELPMFPNSCESYTKQTQSPVIRQALRELCDDCWKTNPGERIDMKSIILRLDRISVRDSHPENTTTLQRSPPVRSDSGSTDSSSSSDTTLCGSGTDERKTRWKPEDCLHSDFESTPKEYHRKDAQVPPRCENSSVWRTVVDQILSALRFLHIVR